MACDDTSVRAIKPSTVITDYTAYITAANAILEQLLLLPCASGLSSTTQEQICNYLAAFLASVVDPVLISDEFENAKQVFQRGMKGTGFNANDYGQMAVLLSGGCLNQVEQQLATMDFSGPGSFI